MPTRHITRHTIRQRLPLLASLPLAMSLALAGTAIAADDTSATNSELESLKQRIALLETQQKSASPATTPAATPASSTRFTYKGYVKADALFSKFSAGEVAETSGLRDFYLPSAIPVGTAPSSTVFDVHAKQSRLIFGTETPANGKSVKTHIELDFMSAVDGNERVSNGYEPELRQAFVQYDRWLVGQAWSNFQDTAALPDSLDFIGPTEGTVFSRQTQLRYTAGGLSVSAENAETAITGFTGTCTTTPTNTCNFTSGDNRLPDITARYVWKGDFGHLSLGALLRELATHDGTTGKKENESGVGVSFSGKIRLGEGNDVRFMATTGSGIGRYVGLNIVNDVVQDATGALEAIDLTAGFVALHHQWSPRLRSMGSLSMFTADNPVAKTGLTTTKSVESMMANLIWSPLDRLDVGIELSHATRETEDGKDGDMDRVQFSSKYSF